MLYQANLALQKGTAMHVNDMQGANLHLLPLRAAQMSAHLVTFAEIYDRSASSRDFIASGRGGSHHRRLAPTPTVITPSTNASHCQPLMPSEPSRDIKIAAMGADMSCAIMMAAFVAARGSVKSVLG